jgi:hypothetical protein
MTSMRVRRWNAYASNNSGSYTIVGDLPSDDVARDVADELASVCAAHDAWTGDSKDSPLMHLCRKYELSYEPTHGEDWPQHGGDNVPQVIAIGSQVLVHHHYTLELPRAIGELFYKRGGRVLLEQIHAHNPMAMVARFWWGWQKDDKAREAQELPRLIAAVTGDGGLQDVNLRAWPAAWRRDHVHIPFTVGVVFNDLVTGAARLDVVAKAHGARLALRIFEIDHHDLDPFPQLRPSVPKVQRSDVVITHTGDDPAALATALAEALGESSYAAHALLESVPVRVARGLNPAHAQSVAEKLRSAGALVDEASCEAL